MDKVSFILKYLDSKTNYCIAGRFSFAHYPSSCYFLYSTTFTIQRKEVVLTQQLELNGMQTVPSDTEFKTLAWLLIRDSIMWKDERLPMIAERLDLHILGERIFVLNLDITEEIKSPEVNLLSERLKRLGSVRESLKKRQLNLNLQRR